VPTILVADDNSNIQKMVSLVFKEKGIRVVAVGNGEAACRKVPEVQPDVVLADVFMPVRNGYEVCEFVKQDPQFAETPVILLVGAFDPLDEKEAQRVGANGVLKKPFVPPEPLIAMVSSLLKLEPPVEEPQPAPAPEDSLTPENPVESGPTARQLAIAKAQAEYAETDETVTTFAAPVAIPSAKSGETGEEEDDTEPASEWARRRATVDYKIDSADSAKMVEKLAAENAVEEPEVLASNKHLPFGGANLPELPEEPAQRPAATWPDFAVPETAEPVAEQAEQVIAAEETAVPVASENYAPSSWDSHSPSEPEPWRATPRYETVIPSQAESPAESAPHADEPVREAAPAPWSVPVEPEIPRTKQQSVPSTESSEPDVVASFSEEQHVWQEAADEAPEPTPAVPQASQQSANSEAESALGENFAEPEAPAETHAQDASSSAVVDQATVDEVVAKVISKLQPQLEQALTKGVLRPLVEEVMNEQRKK
jgi:CheY-like chemotaxis protein